MKILITGAAGFIGFSLVEKLLSLNYQVYGLDNLNSYYDIKLKNDRLLKIKENPNSHLFSFDKFDITDLDGLKNKFSQIKPDYVIHLAAQAGVRYSIDHPETYIDSNVIGTFNILECCRAIKTKHLVMASSSSVYGANTKLPYSEDHMTDEPVSLYAATKKSNELMAHTYSHLFKTPTTCLRFFTVYGPWGRPDMAYFSFTKKILNNEVIELNNNGHHRRDFTYIDDILQGIMLVLEKPQLTEVPFKVYNIGNSQPVELIAFVKTLEKILGRKAITKNVEKKFGDVLETYADISKLSHDVGYKPTTTIDVGLEKFVSWYKTYYV